MLRRADGANRGRHIKGWKVEIAAEPCGVACRRVLESAARRLPSAPRVPVPCVDPAVVVQTRFAPCGQRFEQRFLVLERPKHVVAKRAAVRTTRAVDGALKLGSGGSHEGSRLTTLTNGWVNGIAAPLVHEAQQAVPSAHHVPFENPHQRGKLEF